MCLEICAINLKLSCLCIYTVHIHVCGTWIVCVEGASMYIHSHISSACMLACGTFTPSPPFHPLLDGHAVGTLSLAQDVCAHLKVNQNQVFYTSSYSPLLLLLLFLLFSSPSSSTSLSSSSSISSSPSSRTIRESTTK